MPNIDGYVVITAAGKLKKPRSSAPSIFLTMGAAQNRARNDGDSILPVTIDLGREPLFIRSRKL